MSANDRLRYLTPPQEFEVLKEYLRWRVIQSISGRMEPVMTATEFAKKSGISKPLLTKIGKRDDKSALGQKWAHAAHGLGLNIDASLALSREWRVTAEGLRWLRECGSLVAVFHAVADLADPDAVRMAMSSVDHMHLRLSPEKRERIRLRALEYHKQGFPFLVVQRLVQALAEGESTMAELMPVLDRSHGPLPMLPAKSSTTHTDATATRRRPRK